MPLFYRGLRHLCGYSFCCYPQLSCTTSNPSPPSCVLPHTNLPSSKGHAAVESTTKTVLRHYSKSLRRMLRISPAAYLSCARSPSFLAGHAIVPSLTQRPGHPFFESATPATSKRETTQVSASAQGSLRLRFLFLALGLDPLILSHRFVPHPPLARRSLQ